MADINDILRVAARYTIPAGSVAENVFWYLVTQAAISSPDLMDGLSNWFIDFWADTWADQADTEATLTEIDVDIMNPDGTVKESLGQATINVAGTQNTEGLPAATSGYLKANTQFPKSRGSKYVPGFVETSVDQGIFTSGVVLTLLGLGLLYIAPVDIDTTRLLPGVLRTTVEAFAAFLDQVSTTDVPSYQRRRKPGVGS